MNGASSAGRAQVTQSVLVVVLTASVLVGAFVYVKNRNRDGTAERQIQTVLEQLAIQKTVDEELRAELDTGSYSLEEPLVILDPYGDSPLTAVVLFETVYPSRISVSIHGVDATRDVDFAFDEYRKKHLIPVYGLYAESENEVVVYATDQKGGVRRSSLKIQTEKLHPGLENVCVDILKSDTAQSEPGFTFLYANTPKFAFDANGDIRWCLDLPSLQSTLYDYGGHMILASGHTEYGETLLYEIDLLGRLYSISLTPYGVHHDIEEAGDGKLLVTGSGLGPTVEDLLYELDPSTGEIGVVLDFGSILDPLRPSVRRTDRDWLHMNAVTWSESDSSILVSGRHQSAVVKLSYPGGGIEWILGNHDNWLPEYMKYLLTPTGGDFEWQYLQHSPTILPDQDGNPDTVDVILFDNHSYMDERLDADPETRYSRLVQYRIDEKAKTVEQIWEFGRERGNELFSAICGVSEYLPNGGTLGYFSLALGHRIGYSRVIELRHDTREVILDAVIYSEAGDSLNDYRVTRRGLYSQSDNHLGDLQPCRENIPQDMLKNANTP